MGMPGQGRLGDKANVPLDMHGCPACPHPAIGPAILGSPDVNVNRRPALRVDDPGVHAACCGPNTWTATTGSLTVFINGKAAHRLGDKNRHCGGIGQLVEGSLNVIVGDSGASPAGPATGSSGRSGGGGGGSGGGGSSSGGGGSGAGRSGAPGSSPTAGGGAQPLARLAVVGRSGPSPGAGDSSSARAEARRLAAAEAHPALPAPATDEPVVLEKTFIELKLIDTAHKPVPFATYIVVTADGAELAGKLDANGFARIDGIARGSCQVTFPDFHRDDWS
jgi:uncharacterized Zn-binding protein involved in type VI secretion